MQRQYHRQGLCRPHCPGRLDHSSISDTTHSKHNHRRGERSKENNDALLNSLQEICNGNYSHIFIMGDLNFPDTDWENRTCKTINREDKNRLLSKVRKNLASEGQALNYRRLKNQIRKLTRQGKKLMEKNIAKQNKTTIFLAYAQTKFKNESWHTWPDENKHKW